MSTQDVLQNLDAKMGKSVDALKEDLATIRAGRANPSLLSKVMVDYYGTMTPINQVANVSAPEPRLITVQPWEKTMVKAIEKAIMTSELGLTPNSDGVVIRLNIPQVTEERRKELVKMVGKKAEEYRVTIRNARRDANDAVKKMEKAKEITEDESKKCIDDIQKATDKKMNELEKIVAAKEKEVMEI